jgi:hypothetical protein
MGKAINEQITKYFLKEGKSKAETKKILAKYEETLKIVK